MEKQIKILVTGAKGFIGRNLVVELKNRGYTEIFEFDVDTANDKLEEYTKYCDFVFHLAGVNRPENDEDFMKGNFGFTSVLLKNLKTNQNKSPIIITSSTQAALDNPYGKSKKAGEDLMLSYAKEVGTKVYIYRLTNVFGKWCRPNYNSAVATFCNNIANGLPVTVNNRETVLTLCYIDDLVNELINALEGCANKVGAFCEISVTHKATLGRIVDLLYSFANESSSLSVPDVDDDFVKKLHSTFLTYLPEEKIKYSLNSHTDVRGSFTEMFRTQNCGQFSVNVSRQGITKGNHWHHTKNEKFIVVSGSGVIKLRKINTSKVITFEVSGEKIEVVNIPAGYTHNITNTGDTDMVTFMWCNECYNPEKPDTFYQEV